MAATAMRQRRGSFKWKRLQKKVINQPELAVMAW